MGRVGGDRGTCWLFADCVFDELNWTLTVAGRRVAVEIKPLRLLRQLLLNAGQLVSKDELLDAVWPDTAVVEASLPTAIRKLRLALGDDQRETPIIETVPRFGYRLTATVEIGQSGRLPQPTDALEGSSPRGSRDEPRVEAIAVASRPESDRTRMYLFGGIVAVASVLVAVGLAPPQKLAAEQSASLASPEIVSRQPRQWEVSTALRKMDLATIERMLAEGWNPNTPLDKDRNGALNVLLNNCEWDPGHDQRKLLLVARTLIDGGAQFAERNRWGDTAYSIAKADRYCGPDHPVTQMIEAMCYGSSMSLRDQCLATYELTAVQRKAQGLPPKG